MAKVKYEEMFPEELEERISLCPIVYVPCGLLEWHSSHLPLGVDGLKVEELGRRIATKYGGVVMPPFYIGAPGYTSYQGTITYRPETVKQVYVETFQELEKVGFKVIVALCGHYGKPQETALKNAADLFMRSSRSTVWVLSEDEVVPEIEAPRYHAGPWETFMGVELCGELVRIDDFTPGVQPIKRYVIPKRPDGFECEYRQKDVVIRDDLKNDLKRHDTAMHVVKVVEGIGVHALELLAEKLHSEGSV